MFRKRPAPIGAVTASLVLCCAASAWGAHYGTVPSAPATSAPTLRVSDHAPLCPQNSTHCIETTGATRTFPVTDGDRVTIDWTNQSQLLGGVIELDHLYLRLATAVNADAATPITLTVRLQADRAGCDVLVEYAGTSHHVPLPPNAWQPITVYNPNERTIYVRFDEPATDADPN